MYSHWVKKRSKARNDRESQREAKATPSHASQPELNERFQRNWFNRMMFTTKHVHERGTEGLPPGETPGPPGLTFPHALVGGDTGPPLQHSRPAGGRSIASRGFNPEKDLRPSAAA